MATKDNMKKIVGITVMVTFLIVVVCVLFNPNLAENTLVAHILGIIEGALITVVAYYYGTSKSSQDKTNLMHRDGDDSDQTMA